MDQPLIIVKDLSITHFGKLLLSPVHFSVFMDERVALVGSTEQGTLELLLALSGKLSGISRQAVQIRPALKKSRDFFSFGAQDPFFPLLPTMTLQESLCYFSASKGRRLTRHEAGHYLSMWGFAKLKDSKVSALSFLEYAQFCAALSLLHNPHCILLHEPTKNLTDPERKKFWDFFLSLRPPALLFTTPSQEEAKMAHARVIELPKGEHHARR